MALVVRLPAAPLSPLQFQGTRCGAWITGCSASSSSSSSAADPAWLNPELPSGKKLSRSIAGVDQRVLLDPWLLAEPDSRFAEYNGVQVHYKIARSQQQKCLDEAGNFPAVLLHGFGASVFSWERLMRPLSEAMASTVVAFDRPGFGLTSRPSVAPGAAVDNPYSLEFSASIAVAFADFLRADKVILVGHSAGCIVAADAYLKAPERIAGIVMIAPAIAAPLTAKQEQWQRRWRRDQKDKKDRKERQPEPEACSKSPASRAVVLANLVKNLFRALGAVAVDVYLGLRTFTRRRFEEAVAVFFARNFAFLLRSRAAAWMLQQIMDSYATKAVRSAWYDPEKVDGYVIRGYTKPLGCKNWEQGLLEFVIAMFSSTKEKKRKLAERIEDISCPVLIITGDADRLVPAWNARRLAKFFPNSKFHLIKACGHLPHEETPDEVIRAIGEFISSCIAKTEMR